MHPPSPDLPRTQAFETSPSTTSRRCLQCHSTALLKVKIQFGGEEDQGSIHLSRTFREQAFSDLLAASHDSLIHLQIEFKTLESESAGFVKFLTTTELTTLLEECEAREIALVCEVDPPAATDPKRPTGRGIVPQAPRNRYVHARRRGLVARTD